MISIKKIVVLFCLLGVSLFAYFLYAKVYEIKQLKSIIGRLEAETRMAEVLVTEQTKNAQTGDLHTKIKFLEYDSRGNALPAKYFEFQKNLLQFQTLVVRYEDHFIKSGHSLKGKSVALFWKVFALKGAATEEYDITYLNEVPRGYQIADEKSSIEKKFWEDFWEYAFDPMSAKKMGIKNAQIEAPGTKFLKGYIYSLVIEHDGGLRIDSRLIPEILQ